MKTQLSWLKEHWLWRPVRRNWLDRLSHSLIVRPGEENFDEKLFGNVISGKELAIALTPYLVLLGICIWFLTTIEPVPYIPRPQTGASEGGSLFWFWLSVF